MRFDKYLLTYALGKAFLHLLHQGEEEAHSTLHACGFTSQDGVYVKHLGRQVLGVYYENGELKHYVHYPQE